MPIFLFLFVVFPIVEMVILIQVGGMIGALNTVGLVLLTAVIGAALLRRQGVSTLMRANERMASGELPAREMAEGILLAIGGALLLTPGFVTDAIGFLCLMPGSRQLLAAKLMERMVVQGQSGSATFFYTSGGPGGPGTGSRRDARGNVIIDGEYEREDDAEGQSDDSRVIEHQDDDSQSRR